MPSLGNLLLRRINGYVVIKYLDRSKAGEEGGYTPPSFISIVEN
jgi:hypothetical protein